MESAHSGRASSKSDAAGDNGEHEAQQLIAAALKLVTFLPFLTMTWLLYGEK